MKLTHCGQDRSTTEQGSLLRTLRRALATFVAIAVVGGLATIAPAAASTITLSGTLADDDGNAIAGGIVTVPSYDSNPWTATTGATGAYSVDVESGPHPVKVTHTGPG